MTAFTLERVDSYREAESFCPGARSGELRSFRQHLGIGAGKTVLELGSGNGTLTRCLREMGWTVDTVDIAFAAPSDGNRHFPGDISQGLDFLPNDAVYDAVVSLAVLHHVAFCPRRLPDNLANDIAAVTKSGGTLILQDVPGPEVMAPAIRGREAGRQAAMTTARIFADLVDPHSVPTHDGVYLDMAAIGAQLSDSFAPVARFHHRCDWRFPDRDVAARYLRALFHLDLSRDRVRVALDRVLQPAGAGVALPWALDCLVMRRL